jgi:hypothetical protein
VPFFFSFSLLYSSSSFFSPRTPQQFIIWSLFCWRSTDAYSYKKKKKSFLNGIKSCTVRKDFLEKFHQRRERERGKTTTSHQLHHRESIYTNLICKEYISIVRNYFFYRRPPTFAWSLYLEAVTLASVGILSRFYIDKNIFNLILYSKWKPGFGIPFFFLSIKNVFTVKISMKKGHFVLNRIVVAAQVGYKKVCNVQHERTMKHSWELKRKI